MSTITSDAPPAAPVVVLARRRCTCGAELAGRPASERWAERAAAFDARHQACRVN